MLLIHAMYWHGVNKWYCVWAEKEGCIGKQRKGTKVSLLNLMTYWLISTDCWIRWYIQSSKLCYIAHNHFVRKWKIQKIPVFVTHIPSWWHTHYFVIALPVTKEIPNGPSCHKRDSLFVTRTNTYDTTLSWGCITE